MSILCMKWIRVWNSVNNEHWTLNTLMWFARFVRNFVWNFNSRFYFFYVQTCLRSQRFAIANERSFGKYDMSVKCESICLCLYDKEMKYEVTIMKKIVISFHFYASFILWRNFQSFLLDVRCRKWMKLHK